MINTLIIGAGFAGLGAAIKLREAGVDDIVVLERADRVGGTWRDNTYPGVACDIPSMLYSFGFAQNPKWTRAYAPGNEICGYLEDLVTQYELGPSIRFGQDVHSLRFDESEGVWDVATKDGETYRARTVIAASGPLADASLPEIRGLDSYTGTKILSARWDHDVDLAGKHVAVVGTGATAVQIVPELVKTAASVKVFQRTPGWVMPRLDAPIPRPARALFQKVPALQKAARTGLFLGHEAMATGLVWNSPVTTAVQQVAKAHLRRQVKDPWLRRQLTPEFRAGCKRLLMSSDFYPALQQPNCKLITWPIATISPDGIRSSDGVEHKLDAIVFATGYDVHLDGPPFTVTGLDGRTLADDWTGHAHAYKSISTSGYPNLFFTTGPNSGPGHNSLLVYLQAQLDYAVRAISLILAKDLRYLDVRAEAEQRHNDRLQQRLTRTTWMTGCSSWYLTADGHNASMYPGFASQYIAQMRQLRTSDYVLATRETAAVTQRPRLVS